MRRIEDWRWIEDERRSNFLGCRPVVCTASCALPRSLRLRYSHVPARADVWSTINATPAQCFHVLRRSPLFCPLPGGTCAYLGSHRCMDVIGAAPVAIRGGHLDAPVLIAAVAPTLTCPAWVTHSGSLLYGSCCFSLLPVASTANLRLLWHPGAVQCSAARLSHCCSPFMCCPAAAATPAAGLLEAAIRVQDDVAVCSNVSAPSLMHSIA